ncbi:hypothetical protein PGTUg99_018282 [Puccinia graminis f. sp. tritici]|uniref:Uncharacterized protein n=1 Tax=Puccinia graminis f. sp. tritici TaxID=56615 RepID=A0A5B0RL75_PUCGR|nr:hypothetical protein PGTUg99_018282 [Puccinia graminis f. sp. tritici]
MTGRLGGCQDTASGGGQKALHLSETGPVLAPCKAGQRYGERFLSSFVFIDLHVRQRSAASEGRASLLCSEGRASTHYPQIGQRSANTLRSNSFPTITFQPVNTSSTPLVATSRLENCPTMNLSVIATIAVLTLVLSGICNAYGPVICDSCKTCSAHEMTCELSKNGACGEVLDNGSTFGTGRHIGCTQPPPGNRQVRGGLTRSRQQIRNLYSHVYRLQGAKKSRKKIKKQSDPRSSRAQAFWELLYQCTNQGCGRWYTLNPEHNGQQQGCDHVNKFEIDPPDVVEMCPPAPQPVNYLGNAGNIRNQRLAN